MTSEQINKTYPARRWILITGFSIFTMVLLWRVADLQVLNNEHLRHHGDARSIRVVTIPAHRGAIVDRNHEPLAISTPVESVWAVPGEVFTDKQNIPVLAAALQMDSVALQQLLEARIGREFVYLKRQITPLMAEQVKSIAMPGVYMQREYKRYYPAAEVTAHVIGFTNVDDTGQEGLELAYDEWLRGTPGKKRVLKDRLGQIVQDIESIQSDSPGKELVLSIDQRIQYLAYRELSVAISRHRASSGSIVMLDSDTGEILAMTGQPSYNPNARSGFSSEHYRNRAVTDVFEPGSTMKPITIAAALMSDMYNPDSMIETTPGYFRINGHTIKDINNYGKINLANIISKSSNVGASKIALSLGPRWLWDTCLSFGFGQETMSGFPGESPGLLNNYRNWSEVELATIAFGYGLAVTTLQLAQAYSIIAADGILKPITFLKVDGPVVGKQVLPSAVTRQIKGMLETVIEAGGTGSSAAVKGYRVAGKTGTARKSATGGYAGDRYFSMFSGIAPVSNPRLVLVVMINDPRGEEYYGGQVAAPVFANVMKGALRILDIVPDNLPAVENGLIMAQTGSGGN
jgi:cell division protein FtsI (penicillin-binding protein 3)